MFMVIYTYEIRTEYLQQRLYASPSLKYLDFSKIIGKPLKKPEVINSVKQIICTLILSV